MEMKLNGSHKRTFDHVFQHPLAHNLEWRDVWSMFGAMHDTQAVEEPNGNLRVTRNGETLVLHRPKHKDLADAEELMQVRHFLEKSETKAPASAATGTHLLVVIDHRQARIYSAELKDSIPHKIVPYDPFGFGRDLHYNQDDSNGQRKPEQKSFYEAIAKTLGGAQKILLFGTGTGGSSAMDVLLADLKKHHHDTAAKVVGSVTIDEHHLTDNQLLAQARELFAV